MNDPSGIFTDVADKVLRNVESQYAANGSVNDEMLLNLHSVFGNVCERALALLDSGNVVQLTNSVNNVKLFQITGSSGMTYQIFPEVNFCHCTFYTHQVTKGASFTCKHVLAACLANIMSLYKEQSATPEQFFQTLMDTMNNEDQLGEQTGVTDRA